MCVIVGAGSTVDFVVGNNGGFNNDSTVLNAMIASTGPVACSIADLDTGGTGPDGVLDGSDFVAFINSFGTGDISVDPLADVAGGNGNGPSPDGIIDGNDFIAFINAFAAGC